MMKHLTKIAGAGALMLALLLAACSNPLEERGAAGADGAEGKVAVTIGGGDERTLVPAAEELAGMKYTLVIRSSDGELVHSEDVQAGTLFEKAFPPGRYGIVIHGAKDGAPVAFAEYPNVQVKARETVTVNAVLTPALDSDVPGTFGYKVTLPNAAEYPDGYASALLTLSPDSPSGDPNSGSVTVSLLEKAEENLKLPPGVYRMKVELTSRRQINNLPLKAVRLETVYIYPRLETRADYTFTAADFKGDVFLAGTAAVYRDTNGILSLDQDYKPEEVEAQLLDGTVKTADITNGNWELFIPSHELAANVTSVRLRFKLKKGSNELYSLWQTESISSIQGRTGISLTATTTVVGFNSGIPSSGTGSVRFNHADNVVVIGADTKVTITPATGYGFIGNSLAVSGGTVGSIVSAGGTITANCTITSASPQVTSARFFRLAGTLSFSDTVPASGYTPKSVKARVKDAAGNYADIESGPVNSTTGKYAISVPAGYVFKDSADSMVYFEVTLSKTGQPDITYTNNGNFKQYVNYLTADSSVYDFSLNASDLFTAQNAAATVSYSRVTVTWEPPAAPGTPSYQVQVSSDYGSSWNPVGSAITVAPFEVIDPSASVGYGVYYYRVVATISGTQYPGSTVSPRLQTPEVTVYSNTTSSGLLQSVSLSWNPVPLADYYQVEVNNGSYWSSAGTAYDTYYNHTGIQPVDNTYQYRVTAQSSSGIQASQPSAVQTVTGPAAETASFNSWVSGTIQTAGERKYYRISNPGYSYVNVSLTGLPNGTLYIHRANDVSYYTSTSSSTSFYAYGNDVIVVVDANGNTGGFNFQVSY
jgi:hypothetical protein